MLKHKSCIKHSAAMLAVMAISVFLAAPGWALTPADYTNSLQVTIDGYTGASALTDYPLAVKVNETVPGFSYAGFLLPSGGDLRCTAADGFTLIPHEIESWNVAGESVIWVKIPSLAAFPATTSFWLYWGNAAPPPADAVIPADVWTGNGFEAVYHLGPNENDSTANGHHLNPGATTNDSDAVIGDGQVSNTSFMDASDGWTGILGGASRTASIWMKLPLANASNSCALAGWGTDAATNKYTWRMENAAARLGHLRVETNGSNYVGTAVVADDTWHYVTISLLDDGSPTVREHVFHVDGVVDLMAAQGADNPVNTGGATPIAVRIGCDTNAARAWRGSLDEARISSVVRSTDWIKASYDSQLPYSTFLDFQQGMPLTSDPTLVSPIDGATTILTLVGAPLTWVHLDSAATGYNVLMFRGAPPLPTDILATVGPGVRSQQSGPLNPFSTYYWQIEALNQLGNRLSPVFSFSTGGPPVYSDLPTTTNLTLHWSASNIDGNNNATLTNGQKIAVWGDISGSNNNGAANGAGGTYISSRPEFNNLSAVNFFGVTAQEQFSFATSMTDIRTVFWVMERQGGGIQYLLGSDTWGGGYGWHGGDYGEIFHPTGYAQDVIDVTGVTRLRGAVVDPMTTFLGEEGPTIISTITGGLATADFFSGDGRQSRTQYPNRGLTGNLAELIIFNRDLTPAEEQQIGLYLVQKYDLSGYGYVATTQLPEIELGPPSVTSIIGTGSVDYETTYTYATGGINLTAADISLVASDGNVTGTLTVTNGTTANPTITLSGISGAGHLRIVILPGTATGNGGPALGAGPSAAVIVVQSVIGPPAPAIGSVLWWDGSNLDGSNNSTLIDGQGITTIVDRSGFVNNGTANGAGATYVASMPGFNNQPGLFFVGATAVEQYSFAAGLTDIRTVFYAMERTANSNSPQYIMGEDTWVNSYGWHGGSAGQGDVIIASNNNAQPEVRNGSSRLNGQGINHQAVSIDGSGPLVLTLETAGNAHGNFLSGDGRGGRTQFPNRGLYGNLTELIIYNRILTAQERSDTESYLAAKYLFLDFGLPAVPTVTLISPTNGSVQALGETLTLSATAEPSTDSANIDRVEFYVNYQLLETVTTPDGSGVYTATWTPSVKGEYVIFARAYDDNLAAFAGNSAVATVIFTTPLYVSPTGNGSQTGVDWANAMTLPGAIASANNLGGGVIYMLEGAYNLTADLTYMSGSMFIAGGFTTSWTDHTERTGSYWTDHPTILDGADLYSIFFTNAPVNVVVDGVQMQNGWVSSGGGAFRTENAGTVELSNCIFFSNSCANNGGAVNGQQGSAPSPSDITLINCVFDSNLAGTDGSGYGGAVHRPNGGTLTCIDCVFVNNVANNEAGVIDARGDNTLLVLENCEFTNNIAGTHSGAVYFNAAGSAAGTIANCTFTSNSANGSNNGTPTISRGGAIYAVNAQLDITDCTFEQNAAGQGGAIRVSSVYLTIERCVFDNNRTWAKGTDINTGGAIHVFDNPGYYTYMFNSIVSNNQAVDVGGGFCNDRGNLVLVNNTFYNNASAGTTYRDAELGFDETGIADGVYVTFLDSPAGVPQARQVWIANNIFAGHANNAVQTADAFIEVRNNLFAGPGDGVSLPAGGGEQNSVTGDPDFANAAIGNFEIGAASAGIDIGLRGPFSTIFGDFDVPARDYVNRYRLGQNPDAGVYEILNSRISLIPDPLDFGLMLEGTTKTLTLQVAATGSTPTLVTDVSLVGADFAITANSIDPGGTLVVPGIPAPVEVTFSPPVTGFRLEYTGTLTALSDADNSPTTSELIGVSTASAFPGTNPLVTVDQAATTTDPTSVLPIEFAVVFSEGVNGFDVSDVVWGGDWDPTSITAVVYPVGISGAEYRIAVTALSGPSSGTVTASIPALVASSGAGYGNLASTSTDNSVFYDGTQLGVTVWSGDGPVTNISTATFTITFTEAVNGFTSAALLLEGSASGASILSVTETVTSTTWEVSVLTGAVDGDLRLRLHDDDSIVDSATTSKTLNGPGVSDIFSNTILVDKTAPLLLATERNVPTDPIVSTAEEFVEFRITFSDAVTGLALTDVTSTKAGAVVDAVYGAGNIWFAFVTLDGTPGVLGVAVDASNVVNAVGLAEAGGVPNPDETYTIEAPNQVQLSAKHWNLY